MSIALEWPEIALRLALALAAGSLIGWNRSRFGHPAGLRTTVLSVLAAAVAMVQVNLLLDLGGRRSDSFVMLDLMRLPLGILSGIGFIGAGAIMRRGSMVQGITTAATLWFITVIGLCFGGGQIWLGVSSTALAFGTLKGLKWFEKRLREQKEGTFTVIVGQQGPAEEEIRAQVEAAGLHVSGCAVTYLDQARRRRFHYVVKWWARSDETRTPEILSNT